MNGACALCGVRGPVHRHHVTGHAARGRSYLDDYLVLALCPCCHTGAGGVHQVLRAVGLEWPGAGPMISHRLRRVAVTAELVADAEQPFVLAQGSTRALAALLREAAGAVGSAT